MAETWATMGQLMAHLRRTPRAALALRASGISLDILIMSFKISYKRIIHGPSDSHAPWEGKMIVCQCAGVSDGAILQMIREGASSVAEIGRRTGAGLCCAPCRREIAGLVANALHADGVLQATAEV